MSREEAGATEFAPDAEGPEGPWQAAGDEESERGTDEPLADAVLAVATGPLGGLDEAEADFW